MRSGFATFAWIAVCAVAEDASPIDLFTCNRMTGGTCRLFGCGASRNAKCVGGKCECEGASCAIGGKCVHPTCSKNTGGSCALFGCGASRNAECIGGKCECVDGMCNEGGRCEHIFREFHEYRGQLGHYTLRHTMDGHVCEHGWTALWPDHTRSHCRGTCCYHRNRFTHQRTVHSYCRVKEGFRQVLRACAPRAETELAAKDDEEETDLQPMFSGLTGGFASFVVGVVVVAVVLKRKRGSAVDDTPLLA